MCVADFLNEKFETPFLVEALGRPGRRLHLERPLVGGKQHQPAAARIAPAARASPADPRRSSPRSSRRRRPTEPSFG